MKRLVLIAAALSVAVSANAADDVEFKHSGEFRLRYLNDMDSTGIDNAKDSASGFAHRFKWNITARKGENLQAFLGLLHNATWGSDDGTGNVNPGVAGEAADVVTVNRAWGWWKSSDALSFKFGRMGLEIADGSMFSENDWEPTPTAHEGVMGMWDMDFAKIAFFGLKTDEFGYLTAGALSADPERNLYGVSLDFKNMPEAIKMANVLFVQENRDETGAAGAGNAVNAQRFGLTVGGDTMNILYKGTVGFLTGKQKDRTPTAGTSIDMNAMMYDLMVGYALPETMGLKITGGYHVDTGDKASSATKNEQWDSMYYDVHNYAGLMDVVGWGNLTYWNVAVSMMPTETIEAGLAYYMFSETEATGATTFLPVQGNAGVSNYFAGVAQTADKDIGSELDVWANKSYDGGFKIGARYGMFMPGKNLKNGTPKGDQTISQVFLQGSMTF